MALHKRLFRQTFPVSHNLECSCLETAYLNWQLCLLHEMICALNRFGLAGSMNFSFKCPNGFTFAGGYVSSLSQVIICWDILRLWGFSFQYTILCEPNTHRCLSRVHCQDSKPAIQLHGSLEKYRWVKQVFLEVFSELFTIDLNSALPSLLSSSGYSAPDDLSLAQVTTANYFQTVGFKLESITFLKKQINGAIPSSLLECVLALTLLLYPACKHHHICLLLTWVDSFGKGSQRKYTYFTEYNLPTLTNWCSFFADATCTNPEPLMWDGFYILQGDEQATANLLELPYSYNTLALGLEATLKAVSKNPMHIF